MNTLPAEFISYWRLLVEKFGNSRRAHDHLLYVFESGHPIPGYDFKATVTAHKLRGWSYSNLLRYRPSREQLRLLHSKGVSA